MRNAAELNPSLDWLVTDFTERVADVAHAVVVSSDGVPVAVSGAIPPDRVGQLCAITSGLAGLTDGAARMFDGGAVIQALIGDGTRADGGEDGQRRFQPGRARRPPRRPTA